MHTLMHCMHSNHELFWSSQRYVGAQVGGAARPYFLNIFSFFSNPCRLYSSLEAYLPPMAEPFSVAASVVSVVSLGIQVCQGLLSYYDDYKSYDDTIGSLYKKIEGLQSTLELFEEVLQAPGLTPSKASANVTKSIVACKDGLDSLQTILESCKRIPKPQGLKASIHNYGQQALYPFRRSNVLRLQSTVAELQANVQSALLALQT